MNLSAWFISNRLNLVREQKQLGYRREVVQRCESLSKGSVLLVLVNEAGAVGVKEFEGGKDGVLGIGALVR